LTDQTGGQRTAVSSSFGYYRFDGVTVGQTCVIGVTSKRYSFEPRVMPVVDEMTGLDLTALP
jgi:hypothetical protein